MDFGAPVNLRKASYQRARTKQPTTPDRPQIRRTEINRNSQQNLQTANKQQTRRSPKQAHANTRKHTHARAPTQANNQTTHVHRQTHTHTHTSTYTNTQTTQLTITRTHAGGSSARTLPESIGIRSFACGALDDGVLELSSKRGPESTLVPGRGEVFKKCFDSIRIGVLY